MKNDILNANGEQIIMKVKEQLSRNAGTTCRVSHGTKTKTMTELKGNLCSMASYFAVYSLSTNVEMQMRKFLKFLSRSGDACERKKIHAMQDYLNSNKRVKVVADKLRRAISDYNVQMGEDLDEMVRTNFTNIDVYEMSENLEEMLTAIAHPYIERIFSHFMSNVSDFRPLDTVFFRECASLVSSIYTYKMVYDAARKHIFSDNRKAFSRFNDACECGCELLNAVMQKDRDGRSYRWIFTVGERREWNTLVTSGKKYVKGEKISSIHPIDVRYELDYGDAGLAMYELIKYMFSKDNVDRVCREVISSDMAIGSLLSDDYRIANCMTSYKQYQIATSIFSGTLDDALDILYDMSDDEKDKLVVAYSVSEDGRSSDFAGVWFSSDDASIETGSDVYDIIELVERNNGALVRRKGDYFADSTNRFSFFGFDDFVADIEHVKSTLSLSVSNAINKAVPVAV